MFILYVTCKDKAEAAKISRAALKGRLAACAVQLPARSMYWWKGKLTSGSETILLLKTLPKHRHSLEALVMRLHSYIVPCILGIRPSSVNAAYQRWLAREVRHPRK